MRPDLASTARASTDGEGNLVVSLPVANLNEILSALLYYGPQVRPLSPPPFVERYREAVQKMQENLG